MALVAQMGGLRQLVCVLLLLRAVGQVVPSPPQAGQKATPPALSAEDRKKLNDALLDAVDYRNRGEVQRLLAQGADANAPTSTG